MPTVVDEERDGHAGILHGLEKDHAIGVDGHGINPYSLGMMMITKREATFEEVAAECAKIARVSGRVKYRHGISEIRNRRSKNGVNHRQFTTSKVSFADGKALIQRHGNTERLYATHCTMEDLTFIDDIRTGGA